MRSDRPDGVSGAVLVTGLSGAGKTTVAHELRARGFAAFDADAIDGFAHWVTFDGTPVERPEDPSAAWLDTHEWVWDPVQLDLLVRDGLVFVCGLAANTVALLDRFDVVVVLELGSEEALVSRLDDPTRDNDFGRGDGARERLRGWLGPFERSMRSLDAVPVDATAPRHEGAAAVLAACRVVPRDRP